MIDLTPLEVRKKKGDFKRSMRGYDAELVDDFLELAADRLEEVVRENMALSERLAALEQQLGEFREREKALTEALVTAQEYREEARKQAARDADLLRREAEAGAEDIRERALRAREKEEEALQRVRARRAHLIQSVRAFLERELAELAVQEEALQLEGGETTAAHRPRGTQRGRAVGMAGLAPPPADVVAGEEEEIASVLEFAVDEDRGDDENPATAAAEPGTPDAGQAAAGGTSEPGRATTFSLLDGASDAAEEH